MQTPLDTRTPTRGPWKLFHEGGTLSIYAKAVDDVVHWSGFDAAGKTGRVTPQDVANAEYIVLACNSHARLTAENERLREAATALLNSSDYADDERPLMNALRSALTPPDTGKDKT